MEVKVICNYITTNTVTGQRYVGTHTTYDINDRYLGSGLYLKRAIRDHGRKIFSKEIICICVSLQEAHDNEKIFIERYNTLQPVGYNLSPTGGMGVPGCFSDETIEKLRNKQLGVHPSEATLEKLRKARIGRTPSLGMHHSVEFSQKMSERLIGNTNTLGMILPPFTEEHKRKIGVTKVGNRYNRGKKRSMEARLRSRASSPFKKIVLQYDKNLVFVKEWESTSEAARNLFIRSGDISACARGEQKTSGRFIWRYKNND